MAWTKRQYITQAFDEVGLASYVFDLSPDQLESALRRLDSMMATWNARGIRVGYPLPGSQSASSIDDIVDAPDSANEAIYLNLGLRIAPGFGKAVSLDMKVAAKQAFDVLLLRAAADVPEMQIPGGMPLGAGNKARGAGIFTPDPTDRLQAGNDSTLDFQ